MEFSTLTADATVDRDGFRLGFDLTVGPGEVVGLTGGIGSGKSTALALLAGRLRAGAGQVRFGTTVWDDAAATFVADRPVTLLSQLYLNDLPDEATGTETVIAAIGRLRPDDADPETAARTTLGDLGVGEHVVDRLPWTFSGAEAQRVALAAAIAPHPSVVLLDEPFGALDKTTTRAVRGFLAEWLDGFAGCAVVASTTATDLEVLADRVVDLDRNA